MCIRDRVTLAHIAAAHAVEQHTNAYGDASEERIQDVYKRQPSSSTFTVHLPVNQRGVLSFAIMRNSKCSKELSSNAF